MRRAVFHILNNSDLYPHEASPLQYLWNASPTQWSQFAREIRTLESLAQTNLKMIVNNVKDGKEPGWIMLKGRASPRRHALAARLAAAA